MSCTLQYTCGYNISFQNISLHNGGVANSNEIREYYHGNA